MTILGKNSAMSELIFKSAKRLSVYVLKSLINPSSEIYKPANLESNSPSEITTSLLLSTRNFINAIQSFSYLLSSGLFIIFMCFSISNYENGNFFIIIILFLLSLYIIFLFINGNLVRYFSGKVRFYSKKIIDTLNLVFK